MDEFARTRLETELLPCGARIHVDPARLAFVHYLVRPFRVAVERGWSVAARRYRRPTK
jgi:hypothetical protein